MSDSNSDLDSDHGGNLIQTPNDAFEIGTNTTNEIVEDLTGEDDLLGVDEPPLASVHLGDDTPVIKPRAYQLEMLEESLKQNIIIAADTGSGKTHIAVLRILHELDLVPPHQIIWFLAPTVSLCTQQFEVLQTQITAVQIKCLKGDDGVDRWTSQSDWDTVLKNVRIVVSTFAVLLDALTHAFVKIESLALIVFDEAHNCVGNHPGAKIMKSFYHPRKSQGLPVPHILGLTASPVMRSDPLSLETIEQTLDAVAKTPTQHRAELRLKVNLPVLQQLYYQSLPEPPLLTSYTKTIESLGQVYIGLRIEEDPYVLYLEYENSEKSRRELPKIFKNHKTKSQRQIKSFHETALKICHEMGAYGADRYISEVVTKCLTPLDDTDDFLGTWDLSDAEKLYIAKELKKINLNPISPTPAAIIVSDKVSKLIEAILQESSTLQGIIFVETRAEVAILFHILSVHPQTRGRFRIGTMVGTSAHTYRTKNLGELIDVSTQKHTLSLFKAKALNLVIATSVLEEGIDVPSCNIVVCFQRAANLKSFVQRRGRARHENSKLVLLLDANKKVHNWQQLEADMKRLYEDEMRALNQVLAIEDSEQHDGREFQVRSTGAFLDLDNAMSHLYHFCATLPAKEYVDLRPDFVCSASGMKMVRCQITLPLSVNEHLRKHNSRTSWESEKNAMKDAAFEAYIALYNAGLVNDNLLPLLRHDTVVDELLRSEVEKRASIMKVEGQINPWVEVARSSDGKYWKSKLVLTDCSLLDSGSATALEVGVYLPIDLPPMRTYQLFWNSKSQFSVTISSENALASPRNMDQVQEDTWAILEATFGNRFKVLTKQLPVYFSTEDIKLPQGPTGCEAVRDLAQIRKYSGLIRDNVNNIPYQFSEWLSKKPAIETVQAPYESYSNAPAETPHLSLIKVPKRSDFLHKAQSGSEASAKPYSVVLPITRCTVDKIPFRIIQLGSFIPSILRRFEVTLIADKLSKTLLKDVGIVDLDLIVTAISASSAQENSNYQRLEFLGDSILKTCTSIQLVAEYPLWHEGYLSSKKDRLVSNSRLSRAAVEAGLDKFIITKAFTGHKWRPPYVEDLLKSQIHGTKRDLSSKVLADVVEALIGASMVDGGITKALRCLQIFLPELEWQPLPIRQGVLFNRVPDVDLPPTLDLLESLVGYTFKKKALLVESMTHASSTTGTQSLERLEFLGDSILDNIIVTAMWQHDTELSHFQMHLLRTVLVNADFLAFMCMELSIDQERSDLIEVQEAGKADTKFRKVSTAISIPLWRFMRHTSPKLASVQITTTERHAEVRNDLNDAIRNGTHYPWALLAKLQAQKFYSDIVESLLGAVWIDSGSLEVCQEIVERMGILPYMRRILKENVGVWHPKEEIGVLADTETVKYTVEKRKGEGEEREFWCKLFIGDAEIVEVGGGVGKDEIKTKAAEKAVEILKAGKLTFRKGNDDALDDDTLGEGKDVDTIMSM